MNSTFKIAKWEVMRNLTNKQFIIGLILTPLIMVAFIAFPILIEQFNKPEQMVYQVVDQVGILPMLQRLMPEHITLEPSSDQAAAEAAVEESEADGYLLLDSEFLTTGQAQLYYENSNQEAFGTLSSALTVILQQVRLEQSELDSTQLAYLTEPAALVSIAIDEADAPNAQRILVSAVAIVIIYILIFSSGSMLMMSALQERRDRMAEVILSSIRASDLMKGKILGHFFLGIIQLVFWTALALPALIYFTDFPVLEALATANLPLILFFGLFGYLLIAALFIGVGATMEDVQQAGNSQGMVIMLPAMAFLFISPVVHNPNGVVSQFASLFPFTSWVIIIIRDAIAPVSTWQIVLSGAILLVTTALLTLMAAKIFRVGMLMYGKNATPREIIKWLRYKDI